MKPPRKLKNLDFIDFFMVASIKAVQPKDSLKDESSFLPLAKMVPRWDLNLMSFAL